MCKERGKNYRWNIGIPQSGLGVPETKSFLFFSLDIVPLRRIFWFQVRIGRLHDPGIALSFGNFSGIRAFESSKLFVTLLYFLVANNFRSKVRIVQQSSVAWSKNWLGNICQLITVMSTKNSFPSFWKLKTIFYFFFNRPVVKHFCIQRENIAVSWSKYVHGNRFLFI